MTADMQPPPLKVSRTFPALRETVFRAWSSAEHIARWFSPHDFTIPEAVVEMRPGGRFEWLMRGSDGAEHWTKGTVAEVVPNERMVLDLAVVADDGRKLFRAVTEVTLADAPGGTRVDVVQTYTLYDPSMLPAIGGAPEGWSQTLDRLGAELARMEGGAG